MLVFVGGPRKMARTQAAKPFPVRQSDCGENVMDSEDYHFQSPVECQKKYQSIE